MKPGLHHYFEFLSLLTALLCIGKLRNSFLLTFIPYLFLTLAIEMAANYFYYTHHYSTGWMYNLLNLCSHLFYAFIFYRFSAQRIQKRSILVITGLYISSVLVYYVFTSFYSFSNYIVAIGGIIQVVFSCLHFYEYLQNDNYVKERHYTGGLWIASGVLIFYSGITICFSLYNYIRVNDLSIFTIPLYNVIPRYLSIILYTCISIALIVWKRPMRTLS